MKKWKKSAPLIIIGVLLALTAYVALVWVERQALKDLERKTVVRCIQTCPAGEKITNENVTEYFEVTEVAALLATEQTLAELQMLVGTYPERTISEGEIVYVSVLTAEENTTDYENPIEISITAGIEYAVAGRIRKGDVVNVFVENPNTKTYELVLKEVIVRDAYDSGATLISMSNEHSLASMFTFYVEASIADELGRLYNGNVAIVKVR